MDKSNHSGSLQEGKKIKRKVASYSELDFLDERSQQCWLRNVFMAIVVDIKPDVLRDLLNEPFDLYQNLPSRPNSIGLFELVNVSPEVRVLMESIKNWGEKYNLNKTWCHEIAVSTLEDCRYTRCEEISEKEGQRVKMLNGRRYVFNPKDVNSFAPIGFGGALAEYEMPEGFLTYRPAMQTRENYLSGERQRLMQRIQEEPIFRLASSINASNFVETIIGKLEKECEKAEKKHLKTGMFKAPEERRKLQQHLEWTVQAQVCEKSFTEISTNEGVSISTVSRPVLSFLTDIDLTPAPHLRPGGSKAKKRSTILRHLGK